MKSRRGRMLAQAFGAQLARGLFIDVTLRPLIKHYVHPKVSGVENLSDLEPPFLLAANHSSHMDTPLILMSLPFELRRRTLVAAASDYFFASRLLGLFVSVAVGAVPVDRHAVSRQSMETVTRVLSQKWCLVMYPEGSRTPDGRLYRGKTGIARLALMAGVPVVPVGIVGTYSAMPGGRSWPVRGVQAEVRFGKPLTFERFRSGPPNQMTLRAITDEIMNEIVTLTGLPYADEYATRAKARKSAGRGQVRPDGPLGGGEFPPEASEPRSAPPPEPPSPPPGDSSG